MINITNNVKNITGVILLLLLLPYYYLSGNEEFQTHSLFMTGSFFFQHGIKELVECFNSCHVAGHVSFMLVVFLALVSEMQWYS